MGTPTRGPRAEQVIETTCSIGELRPHLDERKQGEPPVVHSVDPDGDERM